MNVAAPRNVDLPVQYSCSMAADSCVQRVSPPAGERTQSYQLGEGAYQNKVINYTLLFSFITFETFYDLHVTLKILLKWL